LLTEEVIMNSRRLRASLLHLAASSSGVTLIEVLTAIFVMGIGLMALVTLFPLGALTMAQAIKDDRAAAIADQATAFSQAAENLVSKTQEFARESLLKGSVDVDEAARLDQEYEQLALDASYIEMQLEELQSSLPPPRIERYTAPLLAQIRAIERRLRHIRRMFSLIDLINPGPGA
jgi:prepilin-type N-terminal cleavage/methylation domain-containing protein